MHVRELTDTEDQEFSPDAPRRIVQDPDPIAMAVRSAAHLTRVIIPECHETFENSPQVSRYPEMFDRQYFDAPDGPILIDLLDDETPERLVEARAHRRVEFKEKWCAAHGRRYIALGRRDAASVDSVRDALRAKFDPDPEPEDETDEVDEPKRRGRPPKDTA